MVVLLLLLLLLLLFGVVDLLLVVCVQLVGLQMVALLSVWLFVLVRDLFGRDDFVGFCVVVCVVVVGV